MTTATLERPATAITPPVEFGGEAFLPADDLRKLAATLIDRHDLYEVGEWEIDYRWKAKGGTSRGSATLGKCVKVGGLLTSYTQADFVIWLAADNCPSDQIEAVLYHQLLHVGTDEDKDGGRTPTLRGHDFEDFTAVIAAYGAYLPELGTAARTFRQLKLFDD